MTISPKPQNQVRMRPRRNKMLKKGIISFHHQKSTRPCSVHELSETGALIRLEDETGMPTEFMLLIELDGFKVPCKYVRRVGEKIAVKFTGDFEQVKILRKQVVYPSFVPAEILRDRSSEVDQIASNMRAGNAVKQTNGNTDRHLPMKVFGKRR